MRRHASISSRESWQGKLADGLVRESFVSFQGQETKCNCHEFLSDYQSSEQLVVSGGGALSKKEPEIDFVAPYRIHAGLYKLPADAARARLDSIEAGQGEEGWAGKAPREQRHWRYQLLSTFFVA